MHYVFFFNKFPISNIIEIYCLFLLLCFITVLCKLSFTFVTMKFGRTHHNYNYRIIHLQLRYLLYVYVMSINKITYYKIVIANAIDYYIYNN